MCLLALRIKMDVYLRVFSETLVFALERNINLFDQHEIDLIVKCSSLPDHSKLVLSRLTTRKSKWFKASSIAHFINKLANPSIQDAVKYLHDNSLVELVNENSTFVTTFDAVQSCFLLDDLVALNKLTTNGKDKSLGKELLLSSIRKAVLTQRTLFGGTLEHNFSKFVLQVLKSQQRDRLQSPPNNNNGNTTVAIAGVPYNDILLCVKANLLKLLRRCQRLYQAMLFTFTFLFLLRQCCHNFDRFLVLLEVTNQTGHLTEL